jgi:hypothetical protein
MPRHQIATPDGNRSAKKSVWFGTPTSLDKCTGNSIRTPVGHPPRLSLAALADIDSRRQNEYEVNINFVGEISS